MLWFSEIPPNMPELSQEIKAIDPKAGYIFLLIVIILPQQARFVEPKLQLF
jgi:hypothetical protein